MGSDDELGLLMRACAEAADAVPPGHPARNELRLLRGKLESLDAVRTLMRPGEQDAMLRALLASEHSGIARIEQLLGRKGPWPRGEADPEWPPPAGTASAEASQPGAACSEFERSPLQRRLLEVEQPADSIGRDGTSSVVQSAAIGQPLSRRLFGSMLDRPPPWRTDCDCCFSECPADRVCLLQSDSLYIACRGDSIGSLLDKQWDARCAATRILCAPHELTARPRCGRPNTCAALAIIAVVLAVRWIHAQVMLFMRRRERLGARYSRPADTDVQEHED